MHSNRQQSQKQERQESRQEETELPKIRKARQVRAKHEPDPEQEASKKRTGATRARLHNRIPAVMLHVSRYSFEGQARLAADVGVSRSTISRFLRGHTLPSYALVEAVARALSVRLGKPLSPRELVSFDGTYPTASTCALVGCRGCLPEQAYDADGNLLPQWQGANPGDWSHFPEMPVFPMAIPRTPTSEPPKTALPGKVETSNRPAPALAHASS